MLVRLATGRSFCTLLASASLCVLPASAQTPRWDIDDLLLSQTAGSYAISPDNGHVVWTKSEMDTEKGRRFSNLWVTRVADGESWPLTRGKDSFGSPRWSPDGELIAFTSSREVQDSSPDATGSQLWLIRVAGGEPWPVTTTVRGLRQFAWKGASGDTILLTAQELIGEYDRAKKKEQDTGYAVEDTLDSPPVRIWALAVESKKVTRLTSNRERIEAMAVSPDGREAIVRTTASLSYGYDAKRPPTTHHVDLATGAMRQILTGDATVMGRPYRIVPGSMEWTADGRAVLMAFEYSSHPIYRSATISLLGLYDPRADRFTPIDLGWERGLSSFEVVPDGFIATLEDGVRTRLARYGANRSEAEVAERAAAVAGWGGNGEGWHRTWIEGEHATRMSGWTASDDGQRIAYTMSTATTPAQPFVSPLAAMGLGTPTQLAKLNPSFEKKPAVRAEVVRWKGALGEEVEGILYYPIDYREGRRYPLILSIHGGPAGADRDAWSQSWSAPVLLYLQRGAFALKTNYHGSCCYGLAWVESIGNGKYYDLEVPDLEAGVEHLIERGLVHPDSVATAGWSNGAILSTALTVHNPERYRAAIVGAGDVEWISDWGNVDFGASFDNYYFGKSPLEDPQLYIDKSPFFRLDRVRAPTLLFTGTEDRNVPPSQSWSHFRALQQLGNVETRLVLFPGEPHGLGKLAHQRRKVEEEMRWLDRFLWGRPDTTILALNPSSPLAGLLRMRAAARVDGRYGVLVNGLLVPETVARDSLDVARFEVTRAQWQAFDPAYRYEPGMENHPIHGIDFDRARQYASWLTERTGRAFRLPTQKEWDALGAGSAGNTLDYWAGYAPNPEDAERLRAEIARLEGDSPLLRAVGATVADAAGDPPVYDLAGNVAEWVVGEGGGGAPAGASADQPKDRLDGERKPGPAYIGLRVVAGR
jgi:dipeptidyl aminopeptidase/acylaminoacyl peptidase